MSKRMMLVSVFVVVAAILFSGCDVTVGEVTSSAAEDLKTNTETVVDGGKEVIKATVKVYVSEPIKITVKAVEDGVEEGVEAVVSDVTGQVCKSIGQETCDWIDEQVK